MKGYIHSIETFGTLDGPGIRYVIFLQGCPLRCQYCHNPDSWGFGERRSVSVEELVADALGCKPFYKNGGVTLSGGEPLAQPDFAYEIVKRMREEGLHTAIDTSGIVSIEICGEAVAEADLIILDLKHIDPEKCRLLTGRDNKNAIRLLDFCEKRQKKVWIRHVVVPGLSDDMEDLERMAVFLKEYSCVEKVEILPFHKMGEYKWKEMNLPYKLSDTPMPDAKTIKSAKEIFVKHGLNLV